MLDDKATSIWHPVRIKHITKDSHTVRGPKMKMLTEIDKHGYKEKEGNIERRQKRKKIERYFNEETHLKKKKIIS